MNSIDTDDTSEHNLYLLVDHELDPGSKEKLLKRVNASPTLKQKLADIFIVKELISLAYTSETSKSKAKVGRSSPPATSLFVALAASLIMGLGVLTGWMSHQHYNSAVPVLSDAHSSEAVPRQGILKVESIRNVRKFIIHVNFLNEARLNRAVVETVSILDSYASVGIPVQMEMTFNMQAVHIFKPQNIDQALKVKALVSLYENLKLYACSESIDKFLGDFEMPENMSVFHADRVVEEMITERINQGWIYIKV